MLFNVIGSVLDPFISNGLLGEENTAILGHLIEYLFIAFLIFLSIHTDCLKGVFEALEVMLRWSTAYNEADILSNFVNIVFIFIVFEIVKKAFDS